MVVLNSSLIYSVNHADNGNLIVIKKTGSKFIYFGVTKEIFNEFITSNDPDKYLTKLAAIYTNMKKKITSDDEYSGN